MSTTYDELKTLEEGPKDIREEVTKKSDKSKFYVKLSLTLSLILTIFVGFETHYIVSLHYPDTTVGFNHALKTVYNSSRRNLKYVHFTRKHYTCDDYEWGCCEIYDDCRYSKDLTLTQYITLKMEGISDFGRIMPIPKKDEQGTNCPSVNELVKNYNKHYPLEKRCEDSKEGCCEIEVGCYEHVVENHNITITPENIYITKNINVNRGDGCPTVSSLMQAYIHNYPAKLGGWRILTVVLLLVVAIVGCLGSK
jgi:hypothetical protein